MEGSAREPSTPSSRRRPGSTVPLLALWQVGAPRRASRSREVGPGFRRDDGGGVRRVRWLARGGSAGQPAADSDGEERVLQLDFDRAEYRRRIEGAQRLMAERGIDGLLLTSEANIRYL